MEFPAYTDDVYWTDVIEQYIQNNRIWMQCRITMTEITLSQVVDLFGLAGTKESSAHHYVKNIIGIT